ncbi:MAG: hypothetical protein UT00_C0032G0007, partial [Parcubacteria group bacterium GW2011_GWA1_38_7]
MNKIRAILIVFFFLFISTGTAFAQNNRFGIHIIEEQDLEDAANLVNSQGGDWGYVTLVIRQDDRDVAKWQKIFDKMRRLHLIPLVRLATQSKGSTWVKPTPDQAAQWVSFLNSLNWVVQKRFVILFNEPNHDKEWGGKSDPAEYTKIVNEFASELRKSNSDYFILPAGFDLSAGNTPGTMDVEDFYNQMYKVDPQIFKLFDGWSSHSYPNPNFSGSVDATGRQSIRGYKWELSNLSSKGLRSDIPVFITETGWAHKEGVLNLTSALPADNLADLLKAAYEKVWNDNQIWAVTPFVLSYLDPPFDHFSWRDNHSKQFFKFYETVKNMPKLAGRPQQISNIDFSESPLPTKLFVSSFYTFDPKIKNTGQSIWKEGDVTVKFESKFGIISAKTGAIPALEPGQESPLKFSLETAKDPSTDSLRIEFFHKGKPIGKQIVAEIQTLAPAALVVKNILGWKTNTTAHDYKLVIYDGDRFVKEFVSFSVVNGIGKIEEIHNIVPNKMYRFVLLKKGYLPKQL